MANTKCNGDHTKARCCDLNRGDYKTVGSIDCAGEFFHEACLMLYDAVIHDRVKQMSEKESK